MSDSYSTVVIGVSAASETAALRVTAALEAAGLRVTDRHQVDPAELDRTASGATLGGADLVVVTGRAEHIQAPLDAMVDRRVPVFDGLFAVRRFREAGGSALAEAFACSMGNRSLSP